MSPSLIAAGASSLITEKRFLIPILATHNIDITGGSVVVSMCDAQVVIEMGRKL